MAIREEQKIQRHNQILMISLDEFISKGYYGTSTREISKKAGISSGLMFHYFENKESLYLSLIKIGCNKMDTFSVDFVDNPLSFFEEKLSQIFYELQNNKFFAKMFVFMNNAQYTKGISDEANELLSKVDVIRQSIPLIEQGQKMGQFKSGDSHALSLAFWCAVQGIAQVLARYPEVPLPCVEWVLDILKK